MRKTIILPSLHSSQQIVAADNTRFIVLAAGRRFGKGILSIGEAFKRGIGKKKKCRWISPSYASDSYQAGWNMAENLAKQISGVQVLYQKKEFSFASFGGGFLQFRTAEEPDSLRGEGIDFVIFDEAAHIRGLKDIWEQSVRPSLMDRQGGAWFLSTPKGFNYFYELSKRHLNEKDWKFHQFPTSSNPHLLASEIEAMRRDMPALVASQEVDAQFVQLAGNLFKRENIKVIDREPEGLRWVRSWDLAFTTKTTSDYTAGGKMAIMPDGTVVLSDVIHGRMEWPDVIKTISSTAKLDSSAVQIGVECVGAQVGMLQELLRDPSLLQVPIRPIEVKADKLTRALPLVARSEQGKFAIVRGAWNRAFIDELCSFPEGTHDDQCDMVSGGLKMLTDSTGFTSASQFSTGTIDPEGIDIEYAPPEELNL